MLVGRLALNLSTTTTCHVQKSPGPTRTMLEQPTFIFIYTALHTTLVPNTAHSPMLPATSYELPATRHPPATPNTTFHQLPVTSYPSSTRYPEHHIPPATSYQLPVIHQLPRTPYSTFHHPPSTFHHPPSSILPPSPLPLTTPVTYTHKTVHPTNPSLPTVHSSSIITHTTAAHLSRCCDARTTPARTWSLAR